MYEKQFLNDIATQNYSKFNIDLDTYRNKNLAHKLVLDVNWMNELETTVRKGKMFVVNKRYSNEIIQMATAAVTNVWLNGPYLDKGLRFHQPIYDESVKGNAQFQILNYRNEN